METRPHPETPQTLTQENPLDHSEPDANFSIAKSYECTFCKRGFSTAQALGGHMNIHRRERAKLKHSLSPLSPPHLGLVSLPSQSDNSMNYHPMYNSARGSSSYYEMERENEDRWLSWPYLVERDERETGDEEAVEIRQLPLFVEGPVERERGSEDRGLVAELKLGEMPGGGVEIHEGVDLELRLGREPQEIVLQLALKGLQ
ncbi:hypothetical protein AMTRI_Chr08g161700 [Amborella trichopoda]